MEVSNFKAMLKNRMNREKIYSTSEYWDSKAVELDGNAISMWPNNILNVYYHSETVSAIIKYLPHLDGFRLLDIGCGTGRISRYMAEQGATVLGVDFSAKAIEFAQGQSPDGNPRYRVQSIFDLEEDGTFDIVLSWGVVAVACKNRKELLNAMARLCKALNRNGKMLLLEPIHKGFLHRVLKMDIREFIEVMVKAGFKIEDVTNLHFWPMRLALAYVQWPKFITTPGYYLGQRIMGLFGNKILGDYKAIYASVEKHV